MAARKQIRSDRKFGVEIEAYGVPRDHVMLALREAGIACSVEFYNHETRESWKIVSDASIVGTNGDHGFELVSPILQGEAGLAQIRTVCRVLADLGVKVNKTCGLHVHHDASQLTLQEWKNLAKDFLKYEPVFDSLVPVSRRDNTYCRSVRNRFASLTAAFAAVNAAADVRSLTEILNGHDRYWKLNMQAFWRHGTIEFRQHSGTIDAEKICAWVILTNGLIEDACSVQYVLERGADSLKSLLGVTCMPAQICRFFTARQQTLAA